MSSQSILGRLKVWHTYLILSVIGVVVAGIPTYLYIKEASKALSAYSSEQEGMPGVANVLHMIQFTQQHRGLSALVLGGSGDAGEKRAAKQKEADAAYTEVDALIGKLNDPAIAQLWSGPKRDWETLRAGVSGKTITVPQSFTAHTALLAKLLKVNELVGDYYGLSLDPDKDSYQLIQAMYYQLPYLTEELGQLRAKGAGLLGKKEASQEERQIISSMIGRINDRVLQTTNAFGKAAAYNPDIGKNLSTLMNDAVSMSATITELATAQILKPETLSYSASEYVAAATRAIDAQFTLNSAAKADLDVMFVAKIGNFHTERWTMLGTMLALLVAAGYFTVLVTRAVTVPLNNAVAVAQSVAGGNLVNDFDVGADNEVGKMLRALKDMNDSLRGIVGDVRISIDNISAATRDIASGNNDVSSRLESQASNLEETASSMEELTSTVKQNADNAHQANELVLGASQAATKGAAVVSQVVQTMGDINDGSRKIVDIIAVIDGIAFQTNILALNAAVEAARAGEQGRGFAVVASEVRNLAQRSASAAKEIKVLISHSVGQVEAGNQLANEAGTAMGEILSSVTRITSIMAEIAVASAEQGAGIEQINHAVTQMDDMTQQNAALVEQTAAASSSLQEQAATLVQAMSIFKLGNEALQAAARHPAPARPLASAAPRRAGAKRQALKQA
ncbi:methyl-accepting chemotaxis protein [Massilia sp. CCM 9210]|uniref:methyl-accepting chemotaxis protein n=1 Tax=Massilia scottii TaxID=3057166 RepID=UPI002796D140|nr:methyl-accepting chemotaxis protein [Massilia sp. CCM 9210]MDQ1812087.1 methyl-accepting chemotaxis protein [Massilia sp. CCM 9210]